MKIWYITIWDGHKKIDHFFINGSLSAQDVAIHCLNTFYGPDSPHDIFRGIGYDGLIDIEYDKRGNYNIYCTNLIPDISFEKKEITTPKIGEVLFTNIADADILFEGKQQKKYRKDINMTWKELQTHIEAMDEEQANTDVTVHLTRTDEFFAIPDIDYISEDGNGTLDPLHPFLILDF